MAANINEHAQAAAGLMDKANECRTQIADALLEILNGADRAGADRIRNAIGSVAFRKLEELNSYEKQVDAHIYEWLAQ